MPDPILCTFLSILKDLGTPLSRRSFANFVIIALLLLISDRARREARTP